MRVFRGLRRVVAFSSGVRFGVLFFTGKVCIGLIWLTKTSHSDTNSILIIYPLGTW
jgi:hypothetical protein